MRTLTLAAILLVATSGCTTQPPTTPTDSTRPTPVMTPIITATPRPDTTALLLAAREGERDTVRTLIASGAGLNGRDEAGNTALIEAARIGHEDIAEDLIAARAAVSIANNAGQTASRWHCRTVTRTSL